MSGSLRTLLSYQAWANLEFLDKLAGVDPLTHQAELAAALRLMNHCHVVARIFQSHLTGKTHGYDADNTVETPPLADLRAGMPETDQWYLDYIDRAGPGDLTTPIAFTFTDGDRGFMTGAEMITHVVTHGGYHRGEVGQILKTLKVPLPWDTFAVYLHQAQPSRRLQGVAPARVSTPVP
ncbi:DinB family protein [Dongia rigui]|uniref:DinB family protein n=1 Tax=Dongia rigui TaxID=940149 RepID=A0ABU5DTL1_9PROT|nr:DinB family protein [Dongia rigui]MDY0870671.1 DinB family protein [Dongia rigui]